ncbi:MAG: glycosyltransferase [Terrimicrobiaceae bacterium]|nr:glycosyltransferase [Terrimicrobiaceae bacterium]
MQATTSPSVISISLVTPSFNQADFLDAAIRSVVSQAHPALQYVLMDGGSTDGSQEIIERYRKSFHHVCSGPDKGQYDAINKGFALTDGSLMGWLNSDDMHMPWTLSMVGEIFSLFPEVRWLTTRFPIRWDAAGRAVNCTDVRGYSREGILRGETLPGAEGFTTWPIQQESTFWRRDLWEEVGGALDVSLDAAADFDLWMRFAKVAEPFAISVPLGGFRRHGNQKTSKALERYQAQAMSSFRRHGKKLAAGIMRNFCRDRLPCALYPIARVAGWLHTAKVIQRTRDNSAWVIHEVSV